MTALKSLATTSFLLLAALAAAQQPSAQPQPQVRVNFLNVCAPPAAEQKEISAALGRIPARPVFAADFEVARGLSTAPQQPVSHWVRLRREFAAESPFVNAQYSFSVDTNGLVETLVLRLREPKDLMQVAIEETQPPVPPQQALAAEASARRIKLERFGKPSVALARCPEADQSAYEPLFRSASQILQAYRAALDVRRIVPVDLAKVAASGAQKPDAEPAKRKK